MFLLIATFKSNKTSSEVKSWLTAVTPVAASSSAQVVVAPSFPYLPLASNHQPLAICAQDVSPFPPGSYTGAVPAIQLKDLSVEYCIIGHSERRRYFHETHQDIANKATQLIEQDITPVLCLSQADIKPQFAALDDAHKKEIIFVYEPPSDIGGSKTAPLSDITTTTNLLRSLAPSSQVLYGGSVNASNLNSIRGNVDGVLVSTASLDPNSFISIINTFDQS